MSFVYETLFPYFNEHINELLELGDQPEMREVFSQTAEHMRAEGVETITDETIIAQLLAWSRADLKITPLKTAQGILWERGYASGAIRGHVYDDVKANFERWKEEGREIGIFSSGSVAAQKLLFANSREGDLTVYLSAYFDTKTGPKREPSTYTEISRIVAIPAANILFLSDIREELEAAQATGFQTVQLLRPGTEANWEQTAGNFDEVNRFIN